MGVIVNYSIELGCLLIEVAIRKSHMALLEFWLGLHQPLWGVYAISLDWQTDPVLHGMQDNETLYYLCHCHSLISWNLASVNTKFPSGLLMLDQIHVFHSSFYLTPQQHSALLIIPLSGVIFFSWIPHQDLFLFVFFPLVFSAAPFVYLVDSASSTCQ